MSTMPHDAVQNHTAQSDRANVFLDDPFADWGNDDLSFKPSMPLGNHRAAFENIFTWPELRTCFDEHDAIARLARQRSRRGGIRAVALGFVGLCAASFAPLILELVKIYAVETHREIASTLAPANVALGLLILGASLASGAIGYGEILRGHTKAQWLFHRYWCERLRQLHFQIIINNLPLAIQSIDDPSAMQAFLERRTEYLNIFLENYGASLADRLSALEEDLAESEPWVSPDWANVAPPAPEPSSETTLFFRVLAQQRFGIQRRFCAKKLEPSLYSPATRAGLVASVSNALTLILLLISIATAITYLAAPSQIIVLLVLAGLAGVSGACIAAMRVLNEGLQFSADTERYRWYRACVESLEHRFETAPLNHKVAILREMELVAYQEMRRFIVAVSRSGFIM